MAVIKAAYAVSATYEMATDCRQYGGGHFFEHDPTALQQLKALTTEMRLGVENIETHSQPQTQSHELGEWTIGHYSDSDSESDE